MKSRSCILWVLGLLLTIASVDTLPDPPAVSPRTVCSASPLRKAAGDVHERRLKPDLFISLLQVRWIALTSTNEPNSSRDPIVLTGFAADPSPPAV
jgi:hypothetical protein